MERELALVDSDTERVLVSRVDRTQTALERMKGLLGHSALDSGEGMCITDCSMIHTIGMHFRIDVVYVDGDGRVLKIRSDVSPWRMSMCLGASWVLELAAGEAERVGIAVGMRVALRNSEAGRITTRGTPADAGNEERGA